MNGVRQALAWSSLFLAMAAFGQGPADTIFIESPKPRLISQEKVQISSIVRDAQGVVLTGDVLVWVSSDSTVLSVDSNGLVTALQLGIARITAKLGDLKSAPLALQVLPLRVDVIPAGANVFVGATLQYKAVALDVNGAQIPNVTWQWQLTGASGAPARTASIDSTGLLRGLAVGPVTVSAIFPYPDGGSQFATEFSSVANATIRPAADFRLTRLLSSDEVRGSFHLRPHRTPMDVNDKGQIAFTAGLDELSTGVLLYDGGQFNLLASAGTPSALVGGYIANFSAPSINNQGEVAVVAITRNSSWSILLVSRDGYSFQVVDDQSVAGFDNLGGLAIGSQSLNDNGDILFLSNYTSNGMKGTNRGLFRISRNGNVALIWGDTDPLPGLSGKVHFESEFGIDQNGRAYFMASTPTGKAIYRGDGAGPAQKIIGVGDAIAGVGVGDVSTLAVGPDGGLALGMQTTEGSQYIVRYSKGDPSELPAFLPVGCCFDRVYSVNSSQAVLFVAEAGRARGLYRWDQNGVGPVILNGQFAPNGEPVSAVKSAAITSQGQIFVQVQTLTNDFVVFQQSASQPLFEIGSPVNVIANLNFHNLIAGSRQGPAHMLTGAWLGQNNIVELAPQGPLARVVQGDRLPGGSVSGNAKVRKDSAGNLYFAYAGGIYRLANGKVETLLLYPFGTADGATMLGNWSSSFTVNDQGTILFDAVSSDHSSLCRWVNGQVTVLAYSGSATKWQTKSPSGGVFSQWSELAVDASGRVMALMQVSDGSTGVFLYANGSWQTAALIGTTQISGQRLDGVLRLRSSGNKFYALFQLPTGGGMLAAFDQAWKALVVANDAAPNGAAVNQIYAFDVNRGGDLAFTAGLNGTTGVLMRTVDGVLHAIQLSNLPAANGDQFIAFLEDVDLRDDRRVYFTAVDILSRSLVYLAEPLF